MMGSARVEHTTPEYDILRISETCIIAKVQRINTSFIYRIGHKGLKGRFQAACIPALSRMNLKQ
ncbi:hypothetical protein MAR_035808, partial [Mya arenaria]